MSMSRVDRKREAAHAFIKRLYTILATIALFTILTVAYYKNIIVFIVLFIVIFFGIISLNCFNIRCLIPGIASRHLAIRLGAGFVYLIFALILISKAVLYGSK